MSEKTDKLARLNKLVADIDKDFGQGSVSNMEDKLEGIERISTGCLSVDVATGGGYPKGRVIEIYGPESSGKTTLAIHAMIEAQKEGVVGFVDAENAFDVYYAQNLGLKTGKGDWLISQPSSGEEGLEITEKFIRSGLFSMVVVDSVAALTPKAEIEGAMGDSKMGLQARLMSQAMRKLTSAINKSNTIVIFINQLRDKIGVVYGCLHGDTQVVFTDGKSIPISKVVKERIKGDVWSFNEETEQYEEKPITDWHYNGDVKNNEDFIHIQTRSIDGRGRFGLTVTPNHKIATKRGWVEAKSINLEDLILSKYSSIINGTLKDFLSGVFVGDSYLTTKGSTGALILQDNENIDYVNWKLSKLSKYLNFKVNGKRYDSKYLYELKVIKRELGRRNPMYLFNNYSDLGLAVWFMDDGHYDSSREKGRYRSNISVKRFKADKFILDCVQFKFNQLLNIKTYYNKEGTFVFDKENTDKIFERICKYVPASMQYKLHSNFKDKYVDFELSSTTVIKEDFVEVKEKRFASNRQMKQKSKYDISIADNHNYLVGGSRNGVIVHNSPETTTGGNALKFYASVRIDIRRIGQNKDGEEVLSNKIKVKIVKNKVAPPFKQANFDIVFGEGIDKVGDILDLASDLEIVKKSGSWYSYEETKLGQGKAAVIQLMKDNPELTEDIEIKVRKELGL